MKNSYSLLSEDWHYTDYIRNTLLKLTYNHCSVGSILGTGLGLLPPVNREVLNVE